jgi:hypothetical protein
MIAFKDLHSRDLNDTVKLAEKAIQDAERIVAEFQEKKKMQMDISESASEEVVNEGYILYKDKNENFSCDIDISGAKAINSEARIVIESEDWNLIFPGKIIGGKCIIPLKKLSLLEEGAKGKIKLEVIAEDTYFVPWEENFTVKNSKKVVVSLHEREEVDRFSEEKTKIRVQNIR